jgi:transposase-like protein
MSACQLERSLGVTYKTAWFMYHRLRNAMTPEMPLGQLLKGVVEVDETYVGGKSTQRTKFQNKTPVVALVERNGDVKTRIIANVTQRNVRQFLSESVCKSCTVNTDESSVYLHLSKEWAKHNKVNHSKKEYARKNKDGSVSHVNTCESFFSLLKRGVYGSWHHVSREHLPKYATEFAFRWNSRKLKDGERTKLALSMIEGKRLKYRDS